MTIEEKVRNSEKRSREARTKVTERFLQATETVTPAHVGPVSFPAYLSFKSVRTNADNSISLTLNVPAQFAVEAYPQIVSILDKPLAVVAEVIDLLGVDLA